MTNAPCAASDRCRLDWPDQRRNLILFASCTGLQYLAAPVLYVGITQAALCDRLGADARTANLPSTLFFAMTAMPALLAWLSPGPNVLKRNLALCYLLSATMLGTLAITLCLELPSRVKIGMVILQGGVSGAVMPAAIALLWEAIGRGSDESRRGLALALAFGCGPLLAVLGSLVQTIMLGGDFFGLALPGISYPWNFVALFGAGVPIMALAAILAQLLIVPDSSESVQRAPVRSVVGLLAGLPLMFLAVLLLHLADSGAGSNGMSRASVLESSLRFGGLTAAMLAAAGLVYHFRELLGQHILLLATLVTILVYTGNVIPANMNLYSAEALGQSPEAYAGVQNTLRFGFKVVAGLLLGWLLTRTNPRAGILATSALFLAAQVWACLVTGPWYLLAFGIHGAGELIGVYAPNYIVSASRRDQLRRNMAFVTMLMVPAAPAGYLFGALVDYARDHHWALGGMTSATVGFRLSFLVCAVFIFSGIALAWCCLPKRGKSEP